MNTSISITLIICITIIILSVISQVKVGQTPQEELKPLEENDERKGNILLERALDIIQGQNDFIRQSIREQHELYTRFSRGRF